MSELAQKLRALDLISADIKATVGEAIDLCRTEAHARELENALSMLAHDLANHRTAARLLESNLEHDRSAENLIGGS